MFGETGNCFVYFFFLFVYFLRILYTCHIQVLSPYPRFIPISAFYPHIRVLSPYPHSIPYPRFIPISAFYPHIRVLSPYPRFIPISAFYPHIRVLSLYPRFIPISAFYPHIRSAFYPQIRSVYPLRSVYPPVRSVFYPNPSPFPCFQITWKPSTLKLSLRRIQTFDTSLHVLSIEYIVYSG